MASALGKRAASAPPGEARPATKVVARMAAAMRAHEHRTAAGLFALFVLVYLWPALVGGDVLSPAGVLWGLPPWRASLPPEGISYYNPLLSDVPMSYYPWDVLARELIRSGTFPAWNPHAFGGTPFFANFSVAWLGPFSVPLWVLPLDYALGVSAALKLWTAAFGTYLLVRELRLGFWPGLLAGFSFALCAFDVVWLTHQAHVAVAVLLPWLLWLTERIVRRGGAGRASRSRASWRPPWQGVIPGHRSTSWERRCSMRSCGAPRSRGSREATACGGWRRSAAGCSSASCSWRSCCCQPSARPSIRLECRFGAPTAPRRRRRDSLGVAARGRLPRLVGTAERGAA